MKILLIPNFYLPQLGGVQIAVSHVARHLKQQGHHVTIVANSPALRPTAHVEPPGITVYRMPFLLCRVSSQLAANRALQSVLGAILCPFSMLASFLRLLHTIRLAKPDVVNLHYVGENRLLCLAARKSMPFKLVVNIHGEDIESHTQRSRAGRWLARETLRMGDRVLSNSSHLANQAIRICPQVSSKSAVVGNGVNMDELACAKTFEHPRRYILSIGRFYQKKGQDILIRAFRLLHQNHLDVDLLIAGDGPEFSACVALSKELDLSRSVFFLGSVQPPKAHALLKGCEAFVLPSRREPFGIVLLEAMAARKPVVATRVGGVPEIVTHQKNGLVVSPECPEELAEAIHVLLSNPKRSQALAENGYQRVRQEFTWERIAQKYVAQYELAMNPAPK